MALLHEEITRSVIGAFYEVYNTLGFGYREHVDVLAREIELRQRGHEVGREVGIPVFYKGMQLGQQRLDMVVDGKVLVETKATHALPKIASRQVLHYLKGTQLEIGLLLHFGPEARY